MNREQRRNAARRGTFVDTETGMVAHGTGRVHNVRVRGDLAPKVPGPGCPALSPAFDEMVDDEDDEDLF